VAAAPDDWYNAQRNVATSRESNMKRVWVLTTLMLVTGFTATANAQFLRQAAPSPPYNPPAILAAARLNAEKLQTTAASWSIRTVRRDDPIPLSVDVLHTPRATRYIFRGQNKPNTQVELARLIETADAWYVTEANELRKCRPYECEFKYPVVSILHELARPRFVTAADLNSFGQPVEIQYARARFLAPAPDIDIRRYWLARMEYLDRNDARQAAEPQFKSSLRAVRQSIEQGVPVYLNTDTGLISNFPSFACTTWVFDFTFLDSVPNSDLNVDTQNWKDCTINFPLDRPENLIMVERNSRAGPTGADCLVVNVVTGQARRIPFHGARTAAGCFINDRTSVIVPSLDYISGDTTLCEIDLKTGENRPVPAAAACRHVETPYLSPDGKTMLFLNRASPTNLDENEILFFDINAGKTVSLHQPFHAGQAQWLPDGSGLLVVSSVIYKPQVESQVGRYLFADGSFTPLFGKENFLILPQRNSILLHAAPDQKWMICDLDGKNRVPLGDGMSEYYWPALSPDGKRVVMCRGRNNVNQLYLIDLSTLQTTAIPAEAGGWDRPTWH
jgi:hypothetical protein